VSSLEERVAALESRTRLLEDQVQIYQVIMSYGAAADSGSADAIGEIYAPDAEYDSGVSQVAGIQAIAAVLSGEQHRQMIAGGIAHLATTPVVHIDGDHAAAFFHGQVLRRDPDGDDFTVWRATAVLMELARTEAGWRVTRRVNRLLDGSAGSHEHFRNGLRQTGFLPGD
jgi:ketosteroid isomerase-like protein